MLCYRSSLTRRLDTLFLFLFRDGWECSQKLRHHSISSRKHRSHPHPLPHKQYVTLTGWGVKVWLHLEMADVDRDTCCAICRDPGKDGSKAKKRKENCSPKAQPKQEPAPAPAPIQQEDTIEAEECQPQPSGRRELGSRKRIKTFKARGAESRCALLLVITSEKLLS